MSEFREPLTPEQMQEIKDDGWDLFIFCDEHDLPVSADIRTGKRFCLRGEPILHKGQTKNILGKIVTGL